MARVALTRPLMRRALRIAAALILLPIGLYLAAAGILSEMPVNSDWREPDQGITIFVQTNGVHTGIVMPASAGGMDWRDRIRAADLLDPKGAGAWLSFGWGDRGFYVETPTWQDAKLSTIAHALIGGGPTVMHVDHMNRFTADANWRPLRLRPDEYRRLATYVAASFANFRPTARGYGARDLFYPAKGHYSAIWTCNAWTGDALRTAGVMVGRWTPFAGGVMRWVPLSKH